MRNHLVIVDRAQARKPKAGEGWRAGPDHVECLSAFSQWSQIKVGCHCCQSLLNPHLVPCPKLSLRSLRTRAARRKKAEETGRRWDIFWRSSYAPQGALSPAELLKTPAWMKDSGEKATQRLGSGLVCFCCCLGEREKGEKKTTLALFTYFFKYLKNFFN